ncbi:MAG: sulfurtransferase/chromate resistance protein [Hyphomicrobiaceae bacterium]|nr:sulfurtransferase/chromate resistance protein [Hyphomicrobiaceae bacterium]
MASPNEITVFQLSRLVGTADAPMIVDVRIGEDFAADTRCVPASLRRGHNAVADWATTCSGRKVVVVCQKGLKLSQGVAAWLRHEGVAAETLEGGFEAWREAGQMLVASDPLPPRDARGRTVWVTRERPKIDRIACPWLIRRFVDPGAVFLFVKSSEVQAVAERFAATPFDIDGVHWSHRGGRCTFDTLLDDLGLDYAPLRRLADVVRGADTARLDIAPEAAGLLAVSLGLSRMYRDDLAQLEAGILVYDAFYRWCRDATDETHNWPTPAKPSR